MANCFSFLFHSFANKCFSSNFFFFLLKYHRMRTAKTPEINFLFIFPLMSNYVEYNLNDQEQEKKKFYENFKSINKDSAQVKKETQDHKLIFHGGLFRDLSAPR